MKRYMEYEKDLKKEAIEIQLNEYKQSQKIKEIQQQADSILKQRLAQN